jgi:hypothetical protein
MAHQRDNSESNGATPLNPAVDRPYEEFARKNDAWDRKVREILARLSEASRATGQPS